MDMFQPISEQLTNRRGRMILVMSTTSYGKANDMLDVITIEKHIKC
jgi:hypothetical protein